MDRLRGAFALAFLASSLAFWCVPLFVLALVRALVPHPAWHRFWLVPMHRVADIWVFGNRVVLGALGTLRVDARGLAPLALRGWYLVLSNHQSWADIVILQCLFLRRIPMLKFFTKREMLWVPLVGLACWALDFPIMQRYSRAYLERHPEARGEDLERTRRACERFRHVPTSIINFLEGTRFTPAKHAAQESPYRHLLRPRAGGTGFILGAMGDQLEHLVDVTLVYLDGAPHFWDFLCGRQRVVIDVAVSPLPAALRGGDYVSDPVYRERVQRWVNALWAAKDQRIDTLLGRATEVGEPAAERA